MNGGPWIKANSKKAIGSSEHFPFVILTFL